MWLGCNGLVWRIIIFLWTSYIIGSPACGWSCVECEPSHLRGKHGKNGMGSTHTLGFGWVSPRCLTGGWTPQAPLYENMQRLILDYLSWDNLTQSLENWGSHQKRMNHCLDMLATRETITPSGRHGQHHHSKHQLVWATCLPKPLQLEAVPFFNIANLWYPPGVFFSSFLFRSVFTRDFPAIAKD